MDSKADEAAMERRTICIPHHGTQGVLQHGDAGFKDEIDKLYSSAENNATERLIELKASLRALSTDDFWPAITEGMSSILGADMCFVMKRVLVDDQESAVEMPPIGEPGACIMAAALHYCGRDGTRNTVKAAKFHAYGCPCAYMRHDKIFLIPDRLSEFITNNPNQLPTPCEAYIAVPLFAEGKCFAHFGAMWSVESAKERQLSWPFIEMILHALEDQISERFVSGSKLVRAPTEPTTRNRVIPHDAVTMTQSLRPYAGSLSHELRTPMQGIVGMLDVMYATVEEACDTQTDPRLRSIFETLKQNIETVQDSSRRAVEAADNVVHAYDMDMSIPDASPQLLEDHIESASPFSAVPERRPEILVAGSNLPLARPNKRRRDDAFSSRTSSTSTPAKAPRLEHSSSISCHCSHPSEDAKEGVKEAANVQSQANSSAALPQTPAVEESEFPGTMPSISSSRNIAPGLRHTRLRELIQYVINEGLKMGGRPDSATATEAANGESIEVRFRGSDGSVGRKMIDWSVDPGVPTTMFIDEKDLSKLISCVFLNAIKFTDIVDGRVAVHAKMSHRNRYVTIKIADNGPGIPAAFLPRLFKPFSQENASLTRSSDGLGLGLMVAKGIARKLGGDLLCTRAETQGVAHGTDFEIKVPVQPGEIVSRPVSPFGSPMPRRATVAHHEIPHVMPLPVASGQPDSLTRALHDAVKMSPLSCTPLPLAALATPPSPNSDAEQQKSSSSSGSPRADEPRPHYRVRKTTSAQIDRDLAVKYPLNFLVAEDNKINRKLLVSMLNKFGYKNVAEAHDGVEAVRQMSIPRSSQNHIDVVLMDLWMPLMDGYEATERILAMDSSVTAAQPTVLAVTADVTDGALERAARVGMKGFMSKPYKLMDLQRLITEYCIHRNSVDLTAPVLSVASTIMA